MANYTEQEINEFLDYEISEADAAEMYSEQMAEAQMDAHSFGMDGVAAADMPKRWVIETPEGYSEWSQYYAEHYSETGQEYWSRTDEENEAIHHNWRLIIVGISVRIDRDDVAQWVEDERVRTLARLERLRTERAARADTCPF